MLDRHQSRTTRTTATRMAAVVLSLVLTITALAVPVTAGSFATGVSAAPGSFETLGQTRPPRGGTGAPQPTATPRPPTTGTTGTTRPPRGGTSGGTAPAPTQPPAQAPSTGSGQFGCPNAEELLMLRLINDYRARNGVAPVTLSPTLTNAAEFHSRDMASRNYFSHDLPGIATWSQNITNFGYGFGTRAENIAAGYSDAQRTFNQWVNSTPHRNNMLNPNLGAIGIGAAYGGGSQYGTYWTTTFGGPVDARLAC